MKRSEYTFEFVEDNFSVAKTSACPNCCAWICFLPDIKSLLKEDSKRVMDLLKETGISVESVEKISVKEWECHNCKTIFINIRDNQIITTPKD